MGEFFGRLSRFFEGFMGGFVRGFNEGGIVWWVWRIGFVV